MERASSFIFDSCSFDPKKGRIDLKYSLDTQIQCTETIQFPRENYQMPADSQTFNSALSALHLIGGISYYKTCCPESIEIRTKPLSSPQANFWNSVYENGLGEFAYKNGLNLWGKIRFPSTSNTARGKSENEIRKPRKLLVPLGGGKDSIVTIEKLRAEGNDITLFRIGRHPLIDALVKALGFPCITVDRKLSAELFRLNAEGALNGHVPITAYLSFLSVVVAELYGFDGVVLSNERSANEGNIEHFGKMINHQWSKSAEAEEMIQRYIHDFVDSKIALLNPLRELSELQIVGEFVKFPQYFELFTSCNTNWKIASTPLSDRKSVV